MGPTEKQLDALARIERPAPAMMLCLIVTLTSRATRQETASSALLNVVNKMVNTEIVPMAYVLTTRTTRKVISKVYQLIALMKQGTRQA